MKKSLPSQSSLVSLFKPVTPRMFFRRYWEREPLLVTRDNPVLYGELPSINDFDFLLSSLTNPQGGWFSLVKEKARPPEDSSLTEDGFLNLSEIYSAYREGYSLLLNQVQKRHLATGTLCRNIEMSLTNSGVALKRHIGANAYLSPSHSKGFSIHYDPHDVFILQLDGQKKWKIYGRHIPFPTSPPEISISPEIAGIPQMEFLLSPGDFLYIPRGFLHEARTEENSSLHLTLSLEVVTWGDLLSDVLENDAQFREALPLGFLKRKSVGNRKQKQIEQTTAKLSTSQTLEDALSRASTRLLKNLDPLPQEGFRQIEQLNSITKNTWIGLAEGMFGSVEIVQDHAILHLPGTSLRANLIMAPAFRYILRKRAFRARDLPLAVSQDEKLKFLVNLVYGGFLTRIRPDKDRFS